MNDEKFKSRQTDDNLVSQARMNKKEVGLTFLGPARQIRRENDAF